MYIVHLTSPHRLLPCAQNLPQCAADSGVEEFQALGRVLWQRLAAAETWVEVGVSTFARVFKDRDRIETDGLLTYTPKNREFMVTSIVSMMLFQVFISMLKDGKVPPEDLSPCFPRRAPELGSLNHSWIFTAPDPVSAYARPSTNGSFQALTVLMTLAPPRPLELEMWEVSDFCPLM